MDSITQAGGAKWGSSDIIVSHSWSWAFKPSKWLIIGFIEQTLLDKFDKSTRCHLHLCRWGYNLICIVDNSSSAITIALDSEAAFFDIDIFSAAVNVDPIQSATSTHDTTVNRVAFWGIPRQMIGTFGHPSDHSTAFTQESVLISHYSSPQQIKHRPLTILGLHLSLFGPQTLAWGCA